MASMGYCRFRNTLDDLRDCYKHVHDNLSREEDAAREKLVSLCRIIAKEWYDGYFEEEEK